MQLSRSPSPREDGIAADFPQLLPPFPGTVSERTSVGFSRTTAKAVAVRVVERVVLGLTGRAFPLDHEVASTDGGGFLSCPDPASGGVGLGSYTLPAEMAYLTMPATVAVEVWMRPLASVVGTRWTRCTPLSNLRER